MKVFKLFIGILLPSLLAAQSLKPKRPLEIGDKMPDVFISGIQNYSKSSIQFSEFRNKLVLLDFWTGACKGCLIGFPVLEAMQEKYGDKMQVIMINYETQSKIDSTFGKWVKKSSMYRNPRLPSVTGDKLFHELFDIRYYPHEVWIDGNGIVKAITSLDEVTEKNIEALLEGRKIKMNIKKDDLTYDESQTPMLPQLYDRDASNLQFYSSIFKFIPGAEGSMIRMIKDPLGKTVRLSRLNMSILELFGNALEDGMGGNPYESFLFDFGKRVILRAKDSSRYFYKPATGLTFGEWKMINYFGYEAVMPIHQEKNMSANMLSDLERYFNVSCKIEKRRMKCLSLIRISANDRIKSIGKRSPAEYEKGLDTTKVNLRGNIIKSLVKRISKANIHSPYVFKDNTGYTGKVDIAFDKKLLTDLPGLRKKLRSEYDLDLVESDQEMDVLVLTEAGSLVKDP